MRLHPWPAEAIREVVHAFDPAAHVYLFGSRVDDQARGGDIDLLIARDTQRPFVRLALAEAVEL